jgi:hypothetical protein
MARKSKSAQGLSARGSKGAPREKLAKAAGYRSDAEITAHFPENRQKLVRQLQQSLADLASGMALDPNTEAAVGAQYGDLIGSLLGQTTKKTGAPRQEAETRASRSEKQASVATQALRQMVLEALSSPLALLPSLMADDTLSDRDKLNRLGVYTAALEAVYEPLEIEPIGDPGESTSFDPRLHESAAELAKGNACIIRQIGLRQAETVLRKAVVIQASN